MLGPLFKKREKPLTPFKTSPGKLKSYLQCPLKYKKIQVEGQRVDTNPSPHLGFDAVVNRMVESYQNENVLYEKTPEDLEKIKDVLVDKFESAWDDSSFPDPNDRKEFKITGYKAAENMAHWFQDSDDEIIRYRNKPAIGVFAAWYPRPLTIWTRLDRVEKRPDGSLRIIDFKSGAREITATELRMDMGIRLQAAAGREIFGRDVTHIAYVYLCSGNTVEISIDELELDLLRSDVMKIVKNIQNERFEPNLGPLCSVCEFQSECLGWRNKLPWKPVKENREKFSNRLRLSYSKMSLFERCPRAYHKLYHEKFPPKPQPFFSFGSCIHAILEDFYNPESREKPTWERMLEIMDEQWRHFRIGYRDSEEEERYRLQARNQLEKFFNRFVKNQKFKPAYCIEKYFELPVGDDSIMTGFIDRIDKLPDGGYIVLDYKTEPTDRTQEAVDRDLQLTLYYWASQEFLGLDIRQLGLFMMSHDKLTTTSRTPQAIPELLNRVIDVTKQIRTESEFAPRINKYCINCDHLEGCSLENEIRSSSALRTMEFTGDDVNSCSDCDSKR